MSSAVTRRSFLRATAAVPLLARDWRSGPPASYVKELERLMRAAPVPGAVIGGVREHEPGWILPLGVQLEGSDSAVTASTLFQAASLTKQATAYAAFALRDAGKLDFERPLTEYLDDLPDPAARRVRIRHVLSHSSGFPNWRSPTDENPAPALTPSFEPGERYRYSGEGYFYLQRILEAVTGQGFVGLMRELVFEPLSMTSSTVLWDPATLDRTARPHGSHGEVGKGWDAAARAVRAYADRIGRAPDELRYDDYAAAIREAGKPGLPNWIVPNAAASLVTTAEDYARFVAAATRRTEIVRQQVEINEFLGWGLGWAIERADGRVYAWQWGDNPGFKNFVLAEPADGAAVFVFTNGDSGARVYDRALTHATGHDHPALFWL
ncbi:MAG: serine hydrolase [Acidobacteria bacterium]|nr:serine hydrolase [Acidobacteriota bacterium]